MENGKERIELSQGKTVGGGRNIIDGVGRRRVGEEGMEGIGEVGEGKEEDQKGW